MNEWDKLCELYENTPVSNRSELIERWNAIKVEGGRMKEEIEAVLNYHTSQEEGMQRQIDVLNQKLEAMQTENKQYTAEIAHHVLTQTMQDEKLKEKTQKLEAIRGLIPKLKCDRCISWVGEPCPETCEHLIYKKIREVLG